MQLRHGFNEGLSVTIQVGAHSLAYKQRVRRSRCHASFGITRRHGGHVVVHVPDDSPYFQDRHKVITRLAGTLRAIPRLLLRHTHLLTLNHVLPVRKTTVRVTQVLSTVKVLLMFPTIRLRSFITTTRRKRTARRQRNKVRRRVTFRQGIRRQLIVHSRHAFRATRTNHNTTTTHILQYLIMIMRLSRDPTTERQSLMRIMRRFLVLRQISTRTLLRQLIRTPTSIIVTTRMISRPTILQRHIGLIRLIFRRTRIPANGHAPRVRRSQRIMGRITFQLFQHTRMNNGLLKNRRRFTLRRCNQTSTFRRSTRRARSNIRLQRVTTINTRFLPSMERHISTRRFSTGVNRTGRAKRRQRRRTQITMIRVPLRQVRQNRRPLIRLLIPNRITKHNNQGSFQRRNIVLIKSNTIIITMMMILVFQVTHLDNFNPTVTKYNIIRRRIRTRTSTHHARFLNRHNRIFINTRQQISNIRVLRYMATIVLQVQRFRR